MNRSSIFSFNTLRLSPGGVRSISVVVVVATLTVLAAEWVVRLDPHPKALPFATTRFGTIYDHLTKEGAAYDLLFMGSSQCAYNISPADVVSRWQRPDAQPIRAFNAGVPRAGVRDVARFYELLSDRVRVEHVVLVVAPKGVLDVQDHRLTHNDGVLFATGQLPGVEQALMNLHLFRYRRQYRDLRYQVYAVCDLSLEGDLDRRLGPFGCGWWPGEGRWAGQVDLEKVVLRSPPPKLRWVYPDAVMASLRRTIERVRSNGATASVLIPPHPPRFAMLASDPQAIWEPFLEAVNRVAQQTGCRLIDHHALAGFGDQAFYDYTHLRVDRARDYSRLLATELMPTDPTLVRAGKQAIGPSKPLREGPLAAVSR